MPEADYIALWLRSLFEYGYKPLQNSITVTGIFKKHLGPMSARTLLKLRVDNSEKLEVVQTALHDDEANKFFQSGIFGFLDVAMTTTYFPKRNLQITLEEIEIDPIESIWAFREAGRDAARKVVELWATQHQTLLKNE